MKLRSVSHTKKQEGSTNLGDAVADRDEVDSERELGGHVGKGVTGGLGSKSRRSAQPRVDLGTSRTNVHMFL